MGKYKNSGIVFGTSGNPQITMKEMVYNNLSEKIFISNLEKNNYFEKSNIDENAERIKSEFPLTNNGFFGSKGKHVRVIESDNPEETSNDFYTKIGNGGIRTELKNGRGTKTELSDGTVIVHRLITSTPGSPAVTITITSSKNVKSQKIHFIRRKK
jgi:hypothetical protein